MKKNLFFSLLILASMVSTRLFCNDSEKFFAAVTAGYVFKNNDDRFKDVYGHGVINAITGDFCYYPWERWGLGAKISYWRKKGRTSFLQLRSIIQEVPVTFYARLIKRFDCKLNLYASLGGGFIWLKEKSYLGTVRLTKGIGEVEVGLYYPIWRRLNITGAFRYLFPPQSHSCEKVRFGGFDLRAGIGFSF